ncbi:hypothetical protein [Frigoriglobus tundricola]|uniref:Uncharacterized protein n=1 Tax=Frigoriglobus tundricola TaxID=2774151 RepID=A0A6M5YTK5_9BACT|nr:hypothetical protein [Frigoriglobus tundricola]QJW96774.1 hypothetical protein FTUN_4333 [Frigoriglobus tundricola]
MKARGGGLLLLLAVPFGLYVGWQVNGVARTDMIASAPPADRGATKDQLEKAHARTAAWAGEVRKAVAVTWQFRPAGPEDLTPDAAASGVVRASALRSADLNDLDLFLSGVERPTFAGKLKASYDRWVVDANQARQDEREVRAWLARPPAVASTADANKALDAATKLINQYSERSRFTDRAKTASWRVQSRLVVVKALAAQADTQYRTAVAVKLPLKAGNNEIETAVETLTGVRTLIDELRAAEKQADEERVPLNEKLRGEIDAQGAVADQCRASLELLKLFARPDLFTNPDGAAAWLKQVGDQYADTKDEKTKALLREKVQEFCDAFVPEKVRLDDAVLLKGERVSRAEVKVKFPRGDGTSEIVELSAAADGLNEFNVTERHPGDSTFIKYNGEQYPKHLQPTDLSRAAVVFMSERNKVGLGTRGPKWTVQSVTQLKNACEAKMELVDKMDRLKAPKPADDELKIRTRLQSLLDGLKAAPALVGSGS